MWIISESGFIDLFLDTRFPCLLFVFYVFYFMLNIMCRTVEDKVSNICTWK